MGDAGGQPADGFEMFARRQPLLGELAFGDVEADADDADHFAVFIAQRDLRRARRCAACR